MAKKKTKPAKCKECAKLKKRVKQMKDALLRIEEDINQDMIGSQEIDEIRQHVECGLWGERR